MAGSIDILVAVREKDIERYRTNLSSHDEFRVHVVGSIGDAFAVLHDREQRVDFFVIDINLDGALDSVRDLRKSYPRLLIVLVDEEADFGLPGLADEMSTEPFKDDDLVRRIQRMMADRRMETLRSDSLPAIRDMTRQMRKATGTGGKLEAAAESIIQQGYDYVGYYHIESAEPIQLNLRTQQGPKAIQVIAPKNAGADDLMGWVVQNGQSRIAGPEDEPNHPLVARGRLGAVACVPVQFGDRRFGAMAVCRDRPGSITQEDVLMLELICGQLAMALSKESG